MKLLRVNAKLSLNARTPKTYQSSKHSGYFNSVFSFFFYFYLKTMHISHA